MARALKLAIKSLGTPSVCPSKVCLRNFVFFTTSSQDTHGQCGRHVVVRISETIVSEVKDGNPAGEQQRGQYIFSHLLDVKCLKGKNSQYYKHVDRHHPVPIRISTKGKAIHRAKQRLTKDFTSVKRGLEVVHQPVVPRDMTRITSPGSNRTRFRMFPKAVSPFEHVLCTTVFEQLDIGFESLSDDRA